MSIDKKDFSEREPNIENLREYIQENGKEIKNYKELCKILDISKKTNTVRKKKQMEMLKAYFEYSVVGYRIIVDEIYDNPKRIVSHERSTYGADIETVLVNMIMNSSKKDSLGNQILYINMKELLVELGFVNESFNKYKYSYETLKKRLDFLFGYYGVPPPESNIDSIGVYTLIDYFYEKIYLQFTQTVKRNLKRLQEKEIIQIEPVYEYHPEELSYKLKWYIEATGETKDTYSIIESCRLETMSEMKNEINCMRRKKGKPAYTKFNLSHIYIYGKQDEYFKRLSDMYSEKMSKCFGYSPKYIVPAFKISLHPIVVQRLKENENYIETMQPHMLINRIVSLNNKILKSTYRGFKKSFSQIVKYDKTSFTYVDGKTGELIESSNPEKDRSQCYDFYDLCRFKILQRVLLMIYENIGEKRDFEENEVRIFKRMLEDDEASVVNLVEFED